MIETCKRFFLMRLLQWSVKSSRPGVLQKRYSEIFGKIHKRTPVLESFFKWYYRGSNAIVFLWILQNFKSTYFVEHLGTVASETLHD